MCDIIPLKYKLHSMYVFGIVAQVEDIVDTGNTLSCLIAHLKSKGASSISVCTFLDKPARRKVNFELVGEGKYYCGFEVISLSCLGTNLFAFVNFNILA